MSSCLLQTSHLFRKILKKHTTHQIVLLANYIKRFNHIYHHIYKKILLKLIFIRFLIGWFKKKNSTNVSHSKISIAVKQIKTKFSQLQESKIK